MVKNLCCVALLWVLWFQFGCSRAAIAAQQSSGIEQINIKPSSQVDERLFLLRVLEMMYEAWPVDVSDPGMFRQSVAELRKEALKLKGHAEDTIIDTELVRLFTDYIDALDAYTHFLTNIGKIEQDAITKASLDGFESGFKGGLAGGSTYMMLKNNDYSTFEAASAALIVGAITYLFDAWQASESRNQAIQQALQAEAQRILDKITSSLMRAQTVSRTLTARHGWQRGEAGFELDEAQSKRVLELIEKRDLNSLVRMANQQVVLRPRDPFARLTRNIVASLAPSVSSETLIQNARDSLDAASLVPEASVYDEYRVLCIAVAASLASEARSREVMAGIFPLGSTVASRFAVALWREALKYEPTDPSGEIREQLAFSLMANNQLDEALRLANEVLELRKESMDFAYNYACLLSKIGDADNSFEWFKWSIERGFHDIAHAKRDPDLATLRQVKVKEFASLTAVNATWKFIDGFFYDDVTLTNNSAFPITNVILDVRLEQGNQVWTRQLKADFILPGKTYKWSNVISIAGSSLTKSSASLSCDQNK